MKLKGRRALITGASRGSGAAMARLFAREGARVALAARDAAELQSVAREIHDAGGEALVVPTDLRDATAVADMVTRCIEGLGGIDILINNAGGAGAYVDGGTAGLLDTSDAAWEGIFALNLRAPFIAAREAARAMRNTGGGVIVNVGSIHGQFTRHSYQAYSASKAALSELTAMWATELGCDNIRVNEIAPGIIVAGRNGGRLVTDEAARTERERLVPWDASVFPMTSRRPRCSSCQTTLPMSAARRSLSLAGGVAICRTRRRA